MVASHQGTFTPPPQFPWCQASAHTHGQAEAVDQDLGAQDQVSAKVSYKRGLLYVLALQHNASGIWSHQLVGIHPVFPRVDGYLSR